MRSALSTEAPYLPQVLAEAGYSTLGLINNPQVSQASGFARGFESIVDFEVLAPIKEKAASRAFNSRPLSSFTSCSSSEASPLQ